VVITNHSVVLDGNAFSMPLGRDISLAGPAKAVVPAGRGSFSRASRPSISLLSPQLPQLGLGLGLQGTQQPSLMSLAAQPVAPQISPIPVLQTLQPHPAFTRRHILSVKQFGRDDLHTLFSLASEMRTMVERQGSVDTLRGKVLCTLFYEPSTRTSTSFEAAMKRCGGEVVQVTAETSSVQKGESLQDTIRTVGCYADAVVLRHPAVGSAKDAAKSSVVPIINAGDGIGEHPTQSLLDVFCIREELGSVNGITITLVGDLKNGRTVHSLVKLLSLYDVTLNFVSPPSLAMPEYVKTEASRAGIRWAEYHNLDDVVAKSDVLYVTRVQRERFASVAEYESVKDMFVINNDVLAKAKDNLIVMHPLPRLNEIDPEVDFDSRRAAYFRQMRYGLFIRMALLTMVLGA
jgi:carbamoyl-phosphate synthase/aspartate carbamoyltransferase